MMMRKTITAISLCLLLGFFFLLYLKAAPGDFTNIYSFSTNNDYRGIFIMRSGDKIFGTTAYNGANGKGSVFSLNLDGSGFQTLKSFNVNDSTGSYPYGGVVEYDSKLYGTTSYGGTANNGVFYSIDKDGSNYTILKSFTSATDGIYPYDTLIVDGGVFYGMTLTGGDVVCDCGVVFSINSDGSGYTVLHKFTVGGYPSGPLVKSGDIIYGMTYTGGANFKGVIFSVNINGSDYSIMHSFAGGINDGERPYGGLTLYSGKLYGITNYGGPDDVGVIFSIDPDGSDFTVLKGLEWPESGNSYGTLTEYKGKFYGTSDVGGTEEYGTIFSIDTDGSDFSVLYNCGPDAYCMDLDAIDAPFIYEGKLYSASSQSGSNFKGSIFTYQIEDLTIPEISNISPADGSYPVSYAPLVTFDLSETGDCRASDSDKSYDNMSGDTDCIGDGTINISCQLPDAGFVTTKTYYFACQDVYGNKDTISTNTTVTYNWVLPTSTPSPHPTAVKTQVPRASNTPSPTVTPTLNITLTVTITPTPFPTGTAAKTVIHIIGPDGSQLVNASVQIDGTAYTTDNTGSVTLTSATAGQHELKFSKDGTEYSHVFILGTADIKNGKTVYIEAQPNNIIIFIEVAVIICIALIIIYMLVYKRRKNPRQ